jgi:hypothetical protein
MTCRSILVPCFGLAAFFMKASLALAVCTDFRGLWDD